MKVCMFTNTYLPHIGGVARSVVMFTEDLRKMGNEVLVVAPEFAGTEDFQEKPEETLRVPAIQNFNGSDFSVRIPVPFQIDNRLDRFRPDIIHSHHPYLLGDAALRVAKKRRLPIVFTHHTRYEEYTHYISIDSPAMKEFAAHLSTEYANLCTAVVAPSRSLAGLIRSRGVHTPVVEIPTGVDTRFFADGDGRGFRRRHHIPEHALVIGHLGRLAPEKNLHYLAAAVCICLKSLPESRFLLVGQGPTQEDFRRMFQDKGVAERLIVAGNQTGSDLADAYHAMDLFVFSSQSETQGMVITEAMASGLPVVALDGPGVREVVKDAENGILLDSAVTENSFAETVVRAAENPAQVSRMQRAARQTAAEFAREVCAQKLERLYQAAVDETSNAAQNSDLPETWERLLLSIQAEWDLAAEKAKAALKTIRSDETPLNHGS